MSWSTQRTKRVCSTQSRRSPGDERQQEVVSHVCRRCVSSPTPAPSARIRPRHRCLYRLRRSEEHTSELQSLMRISYAVFCLKKKNKQHTTIAHILTIYKTNITITTVH